MTSPAVRIALADDQAIVRAGLRALLERQGIDVVLEAQDGDDLLAQLFDKGVDVVLSDIRMPGLDGIEALRQLRARGDATPVLLLTTFDDSELLLRATEAGAQGFRHDLQHPWPGELQPGRADQHGDRRAEVGRAEDVAVLDGVLELLLGWGEGLFAGALAHLVMTSSLWRTAWAVRSAN